MDRRSKQAVPTVQKAIEDVVVEAMALQPGDSVDVEREFPGGKIRFVVADLSVTCEAAKPTQRKGKPPRG